MHKSPVAFVDVDTQHDFMYSDGALYVKGAEKIIPNLKQLFEYAVKARIPIISSADDHTEKDIELKQFPPHCMRGTEGQKKIPETTLPGHIMLPNRPYPADIFTIFDHYDQVILEKNKLDFFTNCNVEPLLKAIPAKRFVVFGVATEYCVRAAVLGLLARGKEVGFVKDAIRAVDSAAGAAIEEIMKKGAAALTTAAVIAGG